jgi:hypothetical protein
LRHFVVTELRNEPEVGTTGEELTGSREHDSAGRIAVEAIENGKQFVDEIGRQCVGRWAIDRDDGDLTSLGELNLRHAQ